MTVAICARRVGHLDICLFIALCIASWQLDGTLFALVKKKEQIASSLQTSPKIWFISPFGSGHIQITLVTSYFVEEVRAPLQRAFWDDLTRHFL